ncbi:MAG: XRE family transcriptional regulator [Gammaproteobacteria bacterium]|jgi:predicted XRE-type DNA-binding protein
MPKKFNDLIKKMPKSRQKKIAAQIEQELLSMPLNELRQAQQLTQQQVAKKLRLNQAAVSKMEHQTDMYISTLSRFIAAMGGRLEIIAHFPHGDVIIDQFEQA